MEALRAKPVAAELKAMQDSICRENILRARRQTPSVALFMWASLKRRISADQTPGTFRHCSGL
jgi:hypothetical protein